VFGKRKFRTPVFPFRVIFSVRKGTTTLPLKKKGLRKQENPPLELQGAYRLRQEAPPKCR